MLLSLLHASSRLLAPGLGVKQQHGHTANGSQPSSKMRFTATAAVPARQSRSTESSEGGRAPKAAPAVLLTSIADSTSRGDAAFQNSSEADQHAVRAPGSPAKAAAAPGVRARRGRLAAGSPAVTGAASCNEQNRQHQPAAPKPSQHRPKALPRRRKLKLPSPSVPDAPATVSSAVAGDASTDAPTAALPATPATASVVPAARVGSLLPRQSSPSPLQQQQQLRTAAPSTPLLQDFLSGRGRLVKSVYRAAGMHELQLQQELSASAPGSALLPPPPQPALPAPQQQHQLKEQQLGRASARAARGGSIAHSRQAEADTAARRARRARLAAAREAAHRAEEEASAAAAALAGVEPSAVDPLTGSLLGGRDGGGAWGRRHLPKPHPLMRLQNAYEVSMPHSSLSWLLRRAIPQLDREAEEQLTQLMRLGEQIEAVMARAQQQLGRPPSAAELAAAAGRELASLQRLGAAGGPAAAAALAQHAPANAAVLPAWTAVTAAAAGRSQPTPQLGASSAGGGLVLPVPAAEGQPLSGAGRRGRKASGTAMAAADAARRLAAAVETGRRARCILGDSQLRLVVRIASRYQHSASVALEDLVQVGLQGLEAGLDKFEPRRGGRLTTTVYWYVHTAVSRGHARMKDVVAVPYTATYQLAVLHRTSVAFRRQHKGGPTVSEVAEELGWPESRVQRLFEMQAVSEVSMEAPLQGGRGGSAARSGYRSMGEDAVDSVADLAAMADAQGAEDAALAAVQEAEVRRATIDALRRAVKPRQAAILEALYGLDGGGGQLQKDVAAQHNLTRARIYQIKELALDKLRKDEAFVGVAAEVLGVSAPAAKK